MIIRLLVKNLNIKINENPVIEGFSTKDLTLVYAFAIMREDFEQAKRITDELDKRKCKIQIDVNKKNEAVINLYEKSGAKIPSADVKMKILSDGMIIDFEKQQL